MTTEAAICSEREELRLQWDNCTKRLRKFLEERNAEMKRGDAKRIARSEEQIRVACAGQMEASRKYFHHVNTHGCVESEVLSRNRKGR